MIVLPADRDAATRPRPDGCICPLNDYGDVVDADPACPKHGPEMESAAYLPEFDPQRRSA